MNKKQGIILIFLILLFLSNQFLQRIWGVHIYYLYSYLDDLLAVPIILGTYKFLITRKSNKATKLPLIFILMGIIGLSFHFEILMPLISNKYTADFGDIFAYVVGALFFELIMNKKKIGQNPRFGQSSYTSEM